MVQEYNEKKAFEAVLDGHLKALVDFEQEDEDGLDLEYERTPGGGNKRVRNTTAGKA